MRIQSKGLGQGARQGEVELERNLQHPKCIVVGLVRSDAALRAFDRNPFRFQYVGLEYVEWP